MACDGLIALDMRAFMSDEMLLELAGGNEGIATGLRRLRDDLDVYIRRIGRHIERSTT